MKRYSLLLVVPLLLLFISQCLGLVSSSKNIESYGEVTYPSPSLGWLHTEGRLIKDAGSRTVILRGATWADTCWQRAHWERHDMTVADIDLFKSCGANVLLVPLNKKAWETEPEYVAEIDDIVNLCGQRGIYVILHFYENNLMDVEPYWDMAQRWAMLNNPTSVDEIIYWEKVVAARYANRSYVIGFGDINEPIASPYDPIYSGYTADQVRQALRNFHIRAIQALHSVNPNLLIFVHGEDWASDLRDYINNPLNEPNVVYTFHQYYHYALGNIAGWPYAAYYRDGNLATGKVVYEDNLKTRALNIMLVANKPFFFAEFSIWYLPDPNQDTYLLDHFDIMRKYGCSWTYFSYISFIGSYSDGCWTLLEVANWSTLSHGGEIWRNELLANPS